MPNPRHFNIQHTTTYAYSWDVKKIKNLIKIYPTESEYQKVISQQLFVTGNPEIRESKDVFGNKFGLFTIAGPCNLLVISTTLEVETYYHDTLAAAYNSKLHTWEDINLLAMDSSFQLFLNQKKFEQIYEISNIVLNMNVLSKNPLDVILECNRFVYNTFRYDTFATNVTTSLWDIWQMKAGVCQDFAHVLIYMLRLANIPARYVSGYICSNNEGYRGDGATHAWVEAYLPNYGWWGLDPTNNCVVEDKHIKVAVGRDYQDVAPVKGEYSGTASQSMNAIVTVSHS